MDNEYILDIKKMMHNFEVVSISNEQSFDNHEEINYDKIPLNSDLMYYLFNDILGFKINRRIAEKVDYNFYFQFKEHFARIRHSKFKYKMFVETDIKDEVIDILTKVKHLIEKAFLKYSEDAVNKNLYSLPNYSEMYIDKINLVESNILKNQNQKTTFLDTQSMNTQGNNTNTNQYDDIDTEMEKEIKDIKFDFDIDILHYNKDLMKLDNEISFLTEFYIDCQFSYLEHICSLLFPITPAYNPEVEFTLYLDNDWRRKITSICNNSNDINEIITELSYIKEVYRNRFSHGMFSREKEIHIQIHNFGMYPLWVGKKVRGFRDSIEKLNFKDFEKTKKTFERFFELLKSIYAIQFELIDNNVPTFLDTSIYGDSLSELNKCKKFVEEYWYFNDNNINMDW